MKASRPFGLAQVSLDCAGCFRSFTRFAVCTENLIRVDDVMEPPKLAGMLGPLCFVLALLAAPIKSKLRFETENAALRHQLTVLRRRLQGRARARLSMWSCFAQLWPLVPGEEPPNAESPVPLSVVGPPAVPFGFP